MPKSSRVIDVSAETGAMLKELKRCGLEKISFTTPSVLDVDIARNSFADDPTTISNSFFRQLFLQDDEKVLNNLQKFITSNNQSSHMWILARN